MRAAVGLLVPVALVLVAAGCGAEHRVTADNQSTLTTASRASEVGSSTEAATAESESPPPGNPPPVVMDDEAPPEDRMAALAEFAADQGFTGPAAALADGDLTVAERRQGFQSALDCMTAQGMEVLQLEEYEGLYGTDFTFIIGWGALPEPEASVVSSNCESRHRTTVEQAHDILTGERFTARAKEVLQDCLATYGVTDDVGDTMDELREVAPSQEAELDCVGRAEQKPPPPADLPTAPAG